jgi:hypothetical protein
MNLIGNTCVASYITRDYIKQPFVNPFVWNIINFDSCYNLVKYWDVLNFEKYDLTKDNEWNFSIIIDDKVKVQYVHYKFSKEHNKITIKNNDVYYNKIWEYIIEKYNKRIINVKKENPIFIFATANYGLSRHIPFTLEQQKMLEELNSPYKIIISFKDMINSDKLICVKQNKIFKDNGLDFSRFIYERAL